MEANGLNPKKFISEGQFFYQLCSYALLETLYQLMFSKN